jgi:hypothetical protein
VEIVTTRSFPAHSFVTHSLVADWAVVNFRNILFLLFGWLAIFSLFLRSDWFVVNDDCLPFPDWSVVVLDFNWREASEKMLVKIRHRYLASAIGT